MAENIAVERNVTEGATGQSGRLVSENSGQFGVSDSRRAQLAQMEEDAGVQHEAADESLSPRGNEDSATHGSSTNSASEVKK